MEEGTRTWLQTIDQRMIDMMTTVASMNTKLDIFMSGQTDHEKRLKFLEQHKDKQDGVNETSERKHTRNLMYLGAAELLLFGLGLYLANHLK